MDSIVVGTFWYFHPLPVVRGGSYGTSRGHLRTPGPSQTVLYTVIAEHLETFLASLADDPEATGLPAYV
jgi:hypothetical protein